MALDSNVDLPSYYSEQVTNAIQCGVFMPDEVQSVIRAEVVALNGELMHKEVEQCFRALRGAKVL